MSSLVIYDGAKRLLSFSPSQFPVSIFPTSEISGNLATVWVTADGTYLLWVFAFTGGTVKQVLKAGSQLMPEFVYPAVSPGSLLVSGEEAAHLGGGYWSQRIIVSNVEWGANPTSGVRSYEPRTADVYTWDGKAYQIREDVPWSDRLKLK